MMASAGGEDLERLKGRSAEQIAVLQRRIAALEQQNSDLEIALQTAIEHGDAVDSQMVAVNERLTREIAERARAESRLQTLMKALRQQKSDLEILVETVSSHADGIDLDWLHRYSEIEEIALVDGLTGIANRRALNEQLDTHWRRALRADSPLSILMLDVDHFKSYNDSYGHQAGDNCLVVVGEILRQVCRRPDDFPARYGGEEFVMLLPDTGREGVEHVIETIRSRLSARALPHAGSPTGYVTVSIGAVAEESPDWERDARSLLSEADRQMYAAKHAGRNTYRIAGREGDERDNR